MKLFFPNGEHPSLDLTDGTVAIGSSPTCQIILSASGVSPRHCEVRTQDGRSVVAPLAMSATTALNGAALTVATPIKGGDLLTIANVACRVVAMERKPVAIGPAPAISPELPPDDGRTRVRMSLPKFVLRGVSGATFGKVFPMQSSMTIGRGSDCDIQIASEEVSRHHARLKLVPAGIMVEDVGSANGTYVNDERVVGPTLLQPGGELRMDVVRFRLIEPGKETPQSPALSAAREAAAKSGGGPGAVVWIGVVLAVIVIAALVAYRLGWFA